MRITASMIVGLLLVSAGSASAATFTNFESHQVHPLEMSSDGTRLFAVNTPDNRLTVYTITAGGLAIEAEIPVGLEPVSVRQRNANEVWVVNHLSDDVSIVNLATMNVKATLAVGDEPTDVVFAGAAGRAFVCVSQEDAIKVYQPSDLAAAPVVVPVMGSDPRALATSPDGSTVYAAIFESGSRTSILSQNEVVAGGGPPPANPPKDPALPAPPDVGLIIRWTGSHWVDETGVKNWETVVPIPYTVVDNDVAVLNANAATPVPSYFTGVGTLNFNLTVNPASGQLYVMNSDDQSLTRFEPNLRGRFAQYRVSMVTPGTGAVNAVHLNPHIDYGVTPGPPAEIALSLSQANAGDWDAAGANLWVAALGSGKIARLSTAGAVTARVEAGEGPTAVVVDDARARAYVLDRFTNSIAIVSTTSLVMTGSTGLGYNPEPDVVRNGRRFLYDARISSGHGDLACASCHAFGNFDNIAWDLGDPRGRMSPSGQFGIPDFHPMKGPMTTQTLRGLAATEPFHWRGDRTGFAAFNHAFIALMGMGDSLATADMQAFNDFIMTVMYPPNPNQLLDRTYANPPAPAASAERGRVEFTTRPHDAVLQCQDCHDSSPAGQPFLVSPGTNGLLVPAQALQESQAFKVSQLRNMYEKTGFSDAAGAQKRGFGFIHDGNVDNLFNFLRLPVFQFGSDQQRRDMEAFLLAFDTGMAPAVGQQVTLTGLNNNDPQVVSRITLFMNQAAAGNVDLVAKGRVGGIARGYLYAGGGAFQTDRASEGSVAETALRALAIAGGEVTYTCVPPGNGLRIGIDRDEDGARDRDEIDHGSDPADPGSSPATDVLAGPAPEAGARTALLGASPNPAGAEGTAISFTLAFPTDVTLRVFDVTGREVSRLLDRSRQQGTVTLRWNGRDPHGQPVAPGVYYYRLETPARTETRSVILAR